MRRFVDGNRLFINIPAKSPPIGLMILGNMNIVYGQYYVLTITTRDKWYCVFYDLELIPEFQIATVHTQLGRMVGAYAVEPADGASLYEVASRTQFANVGLESTDKEVSEFDVSELREVMCAGNIPILPFTPHDLLQVSYARAAAQNFGFLAKQADTVIGQLTEDEHMQASRIFPEFGALLRSRTLSEFAQSYYKLDVAALERLMSQNELFTASAEFEALAGTAWSKFFGYFGLALFHHPTATALGLRLP
jgi:hypothetical protein